VAALNRTDAIGHGHDREAKGQSDAELSGLLSGKDGGTTAEQDEGECADKLGGENFHDVPSQDMTTFCRWGRNLCQFDVLGN
jgi:hypothetical protein